MILHTVIDIHPLVSVMNKGLSIVKENCVQLDSS